MVDLSESDGGLLLISPPDVLQRLGKDMECWALGRREVPALLHQHVDLVWAVPWARQPLVLLQEVNEFHHSHLTLHHAHHLHVFRWWTLAMITAGQNLIQRHTERPNIRREGELTFLQALYRIPEHRAVSILPDPVVDLPLRNVLGQSEVPDLHHAFILHQNVPRRQVPVNVPLRMQVIHPLADLVGEEQVLGDSEPVFGQVLSEAAQR